MIEGKQSIIFRSRRDFISGRMNPSIRHIASLLVQAWPARLAETEQALGTIPGVEVHGPAGPGKLIVTIDVADDQSLVDTVTRVESVDGVIAASLVYHQMDDGDEMEAQS